MADINYGIQMLERNLTKIVSAIRDLQMSGQELNEMREKIIDELNYYRKSISNSNEFKNPKYDELRSYVKNNLYKITENNYIDYDLPEEFRNIIHVYHIDKQNNDMGTKYAIEVLNRNINEQNNQNIDKEVTIESIQSDIDKIHQYFDSRKDMYLVYRRISPVIIKGTPSIKVIDDFLSDDTLGISLNTEIIENSLRNIKDWIEKTSYLNTLFNKGRLDAVEKIDEYNMNHKHNFFKDLRGFLVNKNKLSLLLKQQDEIKESIHEPNIDIDQEQIPVEENITQASYEFKKILEISEKDYLRLLKEQEKEEIRSSINKKLSSNIPYLIANRNDKIMNEAIRQNLIFSTRLQKEKSNIIRGIDMCRRAMQQTMGSKTIQSKHENVLITVDNVFQNIEFIVQNFNKEIKNYALEMMRTREINVDNDLKDISTIPQDYVIMVPDIEDIPVLPPFDIKNINSDGLKGMTNI